MRLDIVSIFPEYLDPLRVALLGKAIDAGRISVDVHDLRDWTHDVHRSVDDSPYGGGPGMVMKPEVWGPCLDDVCPDGALLVVPTPAGVPFTQATAQRWSAERHLVFACGRYEGIDQRVFDDAARRVRVEEVSLGDFVLIDLWGKVKRPRSVYSDLTRVGFVGDAVPAKYEEIFRIVADSRDAAIALVKEAFRDGRPLHGFEVDDAAREVIARAGYESRFIHRTGHNIGQEVHGNGANMDNLETHDERLVLPRTCFSIEPGIYFEEFGVRSEVNVFVDQARTVHVTGGLQQVVVPILA